MGFGKNPLFACVWARRAHTKKEAVGPGWPTNRSWQSTGRSQWPSRSWTASGQFQTKMHVTAKSGDIRTFPTVTLDCSHWDISKYRLYQWEYRIQGTCTMLHVPCMSIYVLLFVGSTYFVAEWWRAVNPSRVRFGHANSWIDVFGLRRCGNTSYG